MAIKESAGFLALSQRLQDYIMPEPMSGCWLWVHTHGGKNYGSIRVDGGNPRLAHRYIYEILRGPIPEGLTLDHRCRVTFCVNPDHLEPVSMAENWRRGLAPSAVAVRRGTCPAGHSYAAWAYPRSEAARARGDGRKCRACDRLKYKKWREAADAVNG